MKYFNSFLKYFFIFFISVFILLLVYISGFNIRRLLDNNLRIIFAIFFSVGYSIYLSCYILFHHKKGRVLLFLSTLLSLILLQNIERNFILSHLKDYYNLDINIINLLFFISSLFILAISIILQFSEVKFTTNKKKIEKDNDMFL